MAPMTRSTTTAPRANMRSMAREPSWQLVGQDTGSQSEREESIEAPSSYDGDEMLQDEEDDDGAGHSEEDAEEFIHPLRETANRVGQQVEEFAQILDQYNPLRAANEQEKYRMTIDMVDAYYDIAVENQHRLQQQHDAAGPKSNGRPWGATMAAQDDEMDEDSDEAEYPAPNIVIADIVRWEEEAQTWDLLRRLVRLRYSCPGESEPPKPRPLHAYSTEGEVWQSFLETDELALERKTVLDWLKQTAEASGEEISEMVQELQHDADRGDVIADGWLYTKHAIKQRKRMQTEVHKDSTKTRDLVESLDPDAPTREGRMLEQRDEYFERAVWLGCYEMLRRDTDPATVRDWLETRNEVWRAVSMAGFPGDKEGQKDEETGNPASNVLWRRMCFALASKGGGDEDNYKRAVYGILSGDIKSVMKVRKSWDDYIFAHYNALLRTQFDNYILDTYKMRTPAFEALNAIQAHGDQNTTAARLIESANTDAIAKLEAAKPLKMLQGVLIANRFSHFIYQQGLALTKVVYDSMPSKLIPITSEQPEEDISKYIAADDQESVRVLAHMLLILVSLGFDLGGSKKAVLIENVVVLYINFLRLSGKEELIPLYCSQLSGTRKYASLCRCLIDVTGVQQRRVILNLIRDNGMDVQKFVKYQSQYLIQDYPDEVLNYPATGKFTLLEKDPYKRGERRVRRDFIAPSDEIEKLDGLLIRSLEWYLLVDGLWSETFLFGTVLYCRFFKHMHLNSAQLLASRVKSDAIAKAKSGKILGRSVESLQELDLEESEDEDLTEIIGEAPDSKHFLKQYMLAEARSFRDLEALAVFLDAIETVTSCVDLSMENQREQQVNARHQLNLSVKSLQNKEQLLLKGWLLTTAQDNAQVELQQLRDAYLPETILAYVSTLQQAGKLLSRDRLMECMDLAALIAAEDSDLLGSFVKAGRLPELVSLLAQTSQELLISTSQKTPKLKTKRYKSKGWTPELWNV